MNYSDGPTRTLGLTLFLPFLPSKMSLSIDTSSSGPAPAPDVEPRLITAEEILAERKALLDSDQYWPHDYNSRCGVWVSCDCPKCRNYYDPTGEETAKALNMEASWFDSQSDRPCFFGFSKIARESYYAQIKDGFYIGYAKKPATLDDVCLVLTPPLVLRPKRILCVSKKSWDEFVLSDDKTSWNRRTFESSRRVWYEEGTNPPIPFADLPAKLKELYA